jgi:hypothetical protein
MKKRSFLKTAMKFLFDYSCTSEVDGPAYLNPVKYEPDKDPFG